MPERPDFQQRQYAFAAHIRDPQNVPPPDGIEDRRMAIYRDLFFNNLKNLLGTFYPVLRKLHDDAHWRHFIRQFMRRHRAKTPYFLELPEEFLAFLQTEYEAREDDFPFLVELAHYEYAELALRVSPLSDDRSGIDADASLLDGLPVKSRLAWVYAYRFPVHRISADYQPKEPSEQPVYLAVYRKADDTVAFLELNPVSAKLFDAIDNNDDGRNGRELLEAIAAEIGYADVAAFVRHGETALNELRDHGILLGARRRSAAKEAS